MLTDPIADYLTRIRNALGSGHDEVEIPASRLKLEMSRILKEQGYILDFASQPGCITRRLLDYFGESLADENCGHCHFCRTGAPDATITLPATPIPLFTDDDVEEIRGLIFEEHPSLASPRQLTRFLCGLASPATTRAKLTRRPEFGRFSTTPFRTVQSRVEACWEEVG